MKVSPVNDDSERRKRRSVYNVERRLSTTSNSSNASTVVDIEQIKNHIKMCQKLFHENKINIHNAWNIKIIDYVDKYVSHNVIDAETILVAATTLDVCIKVYGYKLEYLANEIAKLAFNIQAENENERASAINEDKETSTRKSLKAKRNKRRSKVTITKDKSTLVCSEIPKVTPTNFAGNFNINSNNFENMSTNKIPMDHAAYKFNILNNIDNGIISYKSRDVTLSEELFLKNVTKMKSLTICPEFQNFNVDENDHQHDESVINVLNNDQSGILNNELAHDENGIPIPELDGSMHNIFEDNVDIMDSISDNENAPAARQRSEMITSFCPTNKSFGKIQSELLALSNCFLETVWVGPSHWKNKLIRPLAARFSGKSDHVVAHVRRSSKRKLEEAIDFDDPTEIGNFNQHPILKTISFKESKCTLPPNDMSLVPEFDKMCLIDYIPEHEELDSTSDELDFNYGPCSLGNEVDTEYCSQNNICDDAAMAEVNEDISENLAFLEAPEIVPQTYIPYALRANRISMRKLKRGMLDCLKEDVNCNVTSCNGQAMKPVFFSKAYQKLRQRLPSKIRNELSVGLGYYALLHVANECDLTLVQSKNLNNVQISKM